MLIIAGFVLLARWNQLALGWCTSLTTRNLSCTSFPFRVSSASFLWIPSVTPALSRTTCVREWESGAGCLEVLDVTGFGFFFDAGAVAADLWWLFLLEEKRGIERGAESAVFLVFSLSIFSAKSNKCTVLAFQNKDVRFWRQKCLVLAALLRAGAPYMLYFRG